MTSSLFSIMKSNLLPGAPFAPGIPGAPVGPTGPGAPVGPLSPGAPLGPTGPIGPIAPGCPSSPSAPRWPAIPGRPGAPGAPSLPAKKETVDSQNTSLITAVYQQTSREFIKYLDVSCYFRSTILPHPWLRANFFSSSWLIRLARNRDIAAV